MSDFIDYYKALGVAPDASPDAVKAAFKKLALRYHPDVYKGPDADERMRELLRAYQTLNDPETRERYDRQRAEHTWNSHSESVAAPFSSRSGGTWEHPRQHTEAGTRSDKPVSPNARRDRQRRYAFPDIVAGRDIHVDLVDVDYRLTAVEATQLQQEGLLRGSLPESPRGQYHCHRCHHHWHTTGSGLPRSCPRCHAVDWPEYLLLRCVHCSAVFESEQIRYEVGSYAYGKSSSASSDLCPPYELFPLCPYCGNSHWCPSEEGRVDNLRMQAARRAAIARGMWFIIALIALVGLGVIMVGVLR
ncbi:MAG TPA: J domain-containing protein [Dictyobacter sp.]|jgi:hypothetical protein|nr:J domain-containing protein [Dictyobacter sp.]